jgi:hypothetical protein
MSLCAYAKKLCGNMDRPGLVGTVAALSSKEIGLSLKNGSSASLKACAFTSMGGSGRGSDKQSLALGDSGDKEAIDADLLFAVNISNSDMDSERAAS